MVPLPCGVLPVSPWWTTTELKSAPM